MELNQAQNPLASGEFLKLKTSYQIFVTTFMQTHDAIASYIAAYPTASRVTASIKGHALLRKPKIKLLVGGLIKSGNQIIDEVRADLIKQTAGNVLSEAEIDAQLSKIVMGELEIERNVVVDGVAIPIKIKPDHSDINRAAELLYKRKGSFSPERHKLETDGPLVTQNVIILSNGTQIAFG